MVVLLNAIFHEKEKVNKNVQLSAGRNSPHQCVPGSIPGPGVICGLSLLVLYSAPRGFSPGTPVFPSPQKPTFDLI